MSIWSEHSEYQTILHKPSLVTRRGIGDQYVRLVRRLKGDDTTLLRQARRPKADWRILRRSVLKPIHIRSTI